MDYSPNNASQDPPKMQFQMKAPEQKPTSFHWIWINVLLAALIVPINFFVWIDSTVSRDIPVLFIVLASCQLFLGMAATVSAVKYVRQQGKYKVSAAVMGTLGTLVGAGGLVGLFLDYLLRHMGSLFLGGAWGRPLRIRGKIVHPELCLGTDWAAGAQPNVENLDEPTRIALEALWLHDAQKEHASVPAFSRISWQLTAVGAPAKLIEGAHRAAMQEIDHAKRCFALAAGYGGRTHTVEPMLELLKGGLDVNGDPMVAMAVESLQDGCLLEDFNADVAGQCFEICQDTAVKDVLRRITREERQHADFSWRMLEWLLINGGEPVQRSIAKTITSLKNVPRPTAASAEKAVLVAKANPEMLRAHGRLEDSIWAELWTERLAKTEQRAQEMLEDCRTKSMMIPVAHNGVELRQSSY